MLYLSERQHLIIDAYFACIQDAKSSKNITMQSIADRVGIRRQNIYKKHFPNLETIVKTSYMMADQKIHDKFTSYSQAHQQSLAQLFADEVLPLIWEQRFYLSILYSSPFNQDWFNYLNQKYVPLIEQHLKHPAELSGFTPNFLATLIEKQITAVIATWLTAPEPEPLRLFQKHFLILISTPTTTLLR